MEPAEASVSDLTKACLSQFEHCLALKSLMHNELLENRLADLNLWADGVGATAELRASLDQRFRSRPNELGLVKSILIMLKQFLDECASVAEKGMPVSEAIRNIDSALENLALIAVAIRRTGRRSRLQKADRRFDPDEHRELRLHLACIVLLRPRKDGREADGLDLSKLKPVQERLIDANLRRRNRFLYAQRHSTLLKGREVSLSGPIEAGLEIASAEDARPTSSDKSEHKVSAAIPTIKESTQPSVSGTSASTPESGFHYKGAKRSTPEAVKTQITSIAATARYPKPSKPPSDQKLFKCPCCCQAIPFEDVEEDEQWR
jgi:hypothetical protein